MTERSKQVIELEADVAERLQGLADEHAVSLDEALGAALRFYIAMPKEVRAILESHRPEDVEEIARLQWEVERTVLAIARRIGGA